MDCLGLNGLGVGRDEDWVGGLNGACVGLDDAADTATDVPHTADACSDFGAEIAFGLPYSKFERIVNVSKITNKSQQSL
ncbi:hypothetical protein S83_038032 [Arachis hypogaea]